MPAHLRSRTTFAFLVTAAVALSAGCATAGPEDATAGIVASPPTASSTSSVPTVARATSEPSPTPAPCFTREDLAAMDLETIAAWDSLCYRSDSVETQIDQREASLAIRSLVGEAPQVIAFQEITSMGNSPNGDLKVLRFVDERGYEYLVAPLAAKVLEMDPPISWRIGTGPVFSIEELQQMAEALVAGQFPTFAEWEPKLEFEIGSKSEGMYFFRWERALPWAQNMPALAQVGITENGEIFSYMNTLFYLQEGPPYPTLPASG